jgi:hypothetical protein
MVRALSLLQRLAHTLHSGGGTFMAGAPWSIQGRGRTSPYVAPEPCSDLCPSTANPVGASVEPWKIAHAALDCKPGAPAIRQCVSSHSCLLAFSARKPKLSRSDSPTIHEMTFQERDQDCSQGRHVTPRCKQQHALSCLRAVIQQDLLSSW